MTRIELIGIVDDEHRLSLVVPEQIKAGAVKVVLEIGDDDADWAQGVAHAWAADWNDPREDIYSLNDGVPENGAG